MELSDEDLLEMHRLMALTRLFEENACLWKRRGDILEIPHSSIGQEAIGIGACYGGPRQPDSPRLRRRYHHGSRRI